MTNSPRQVLIILAALLFSAYPAFSQLPQIQGRSPKARQNGFPVTNQAAADAASSASRQEWFRIEYDGKAVGYESLTTTPVFADPEVSAGSIDGLIRRSRETRLKLKRFGNDLSLSARLETVETSTGVLKTWSLRRTAADGAAMERSGIWNGDKGGFDVTENVSGLSHNELLPSRMQPRSAIMSAWLAAASRDSQRLWTTAVLFPETSAIVDMQIRAAGGQSLKLPDGKTITVTRFDYWPTNSPEMKASVYYDDQMEVVRTEQLVLGLTMKMERTDAATALGQSSTESLDLQFSSALPLKRQIQSIDRSESLQLSITVGAAEQISLPSGDFQSVEQKSAGEVLVTLTRAAPLQRTNQQEQAPATLQRNVRINPAYISPTRWITSEAPGVKRMGLFVAGGTSIADEKCRRLTTHVWKQMRLSPFSTSLQPAESIAKKLEGDCTEHAVLLCALMRSQNIPSRVVVGFVYVSEPASFVPHMWTEAILDGKWMPFDSTRGPDGMGLTHIKVTDSVLSDDIGSGNVLFVPLLSFLGRASVDVVQ